MNVLLDICIDKIDISMLFLILYLNKLMNINQVHIK